MIKKIGSILQSLNASPEEVEQAYDSVYDNANKCVHCDEVIPEGGWSCPNCESRDWKSAFMNTFLGGK